LTDDEATVSSETPAAVRYVDLVLGGWRPREAAFQLAASLGVDLGRCDRSEPAETDLAMSVGEVDVGAQGDPLVNQAWEDACRIAAALPASAVVVVLPPRFDLPLRADNEWFFYFLRRLGRSIIVVGEEPTMRFVDKSPFERRRSVVLPEWDIDPDQIGVQPMRLLRLFPGLLPRAVARTAGLTDNDVLPIPIGKDHFLVPISYRDQDPRESAFDFDALEDIEAGDEGFRAIAQSYCTSHFADVAALTELGLRHFRSGSRDLARDLVQRARSVARDPAIVASAEVALLEMSLFERRFAEVVTAPSLSPRAAAPDRERLQRLKSWARLGLADLSGVPESVGTLLRRLGHEDAIDAGSVLQLDGIAGARLTHGDIEGALSVGRSVAAALAHAGKRADPRLVYANAMNLIKIYARQGDLGALSREIDRAFDTSLGARSAGDILLMNFLRAKAEGAPTSPTAAACRLRAGLVWLCHEPREGLGRDAVEAILGADKADRPGIENEISAALADALAESWPQITSALAERVPAVCPISNLPAMAPRRLYAGPGAAGLWTSDTIAMPAPAPSRAWLTKLVCAVLEKICPPFAAVDGGTISTDTNLGIDVPASRDEALSVALRLGVEDLYFGEERTRLDPGTCERLSGDLEVRLSPIVSAATVSGDGLIVTFKRSLPEAVLFDEEARLIAPLCKGERFRLRTLPIVTDGRPLAEVETSLRRLEAARIVRLDVRPASDSSRSKASNRSGAAR
jgi:hypothetical protein